MAQAKHTGREWTGDNSDEAFNAAGQYFGGNTLVDRLTDAQGKQTKAEIATGNGGVIVADINGTDVATTIVSNVEVVGVSLNENLIELAETETYQLVANIDPDTATTKTVTWSTSNAAVATVSAAGLVTAVAAGEAVITVTTTDQGKTDTCEVVVTA
jgi:uncharacterized protein YjdB